MKLLLDTHIVLWWAADDRRLSKAVRERVASSDNTVAVSAATFWEIAIKIALGRIKIDLQELASAVAADGFEELSVRITHTLSLASLPAIHTDPFDRLLIAQAIAEDFQLVTRDRWILQYQSLPGLRVFEA